MDSFPWLLTRIHIINSSLNCTGLIHQSRERTAEQYRKRTRKAHNTLPSLIMKGFYSAQLREIRPGLQEVRQRLEKHTQLQLDLHHFTYGEMT